jgi:hypothetical protein
MESKGHLYIYINQILNEINSTFYKLIIIYYSTDKNYKVPGLLLSSDSVRLEKSYKVRNQVVSSLVWLWWVIDLSRFEFEFEFEAFW